MISTIQRLPFRRNEIKVCHEMRICLLFIRSNAIIRIIFVSHSRFVEVVGASFPRMAVFCSDGTAEASDGMYNVKDD